MDEDRRKERTSELNEEQVAEIRELLSQGARQVDVAARVWGWAGTGFENCTQGKLAQGQLNRYTTGKELPCLHYAGPERPTRF
jgi:phosphosulfolactate synthase (CoM biosynthesis protein A)